MFAVLSPSNCLNIHSGDFFVNLLLLTAEENSISHDNMGQFEINIFALNVILRLVNFDSSLLKKTIAI